jgi:hypothetical protein
MVGREDASTIGGELHVVETEEGARQFAACLARPLRLLRVKEGGLEPARPTRMFARRREYGGRLGGVQTKEVH